MNKYYNIGKDLLGLCETPKTLIDGISNASKLDITTIALELICFRYFCIDISIFRLNLEQKVISLLRDGFSECFFDNIEKLYPNFSSKFLENRINKYTKVIKKYLERPTEIYIHLGRAFSEYCGMNDLKVEMMIGLYYHSIFTSIVGYFKKTKLYP
ncbi:MAG: hypothetical protein JW881_13305 [Spirochaetales bacterium]|nr:hypothetical protein [Spirochaetales bacterium]